jgi:hypothetical protein
MLWWMGTVASTVHNLKGDVVRKGTYSLWRFMWQAPVQYVVCCIALAATLCGGCPGSHSLAGGVDGSDGLLLVVAAHVEIETKR